MSSVIVSAPVLETPNRPLAPLSSPLSVVRSLWHSRGLIASLSMREFLGRYRGSALGITWSLINPLLMLAVYTFVFSVVFEAKWGTRAGASRLDFAAILFCGLTVFNLFSECINRAPFLVLHNPVYVKKVVFPLEALSWVSLGTALLHFACAIGVLLLFLVASGHELHATALLLPVVVLPLALFAVGLSWFLSSVGVFLRDIGQLISLLTTVLLFLSPIFYPLDSIPADIRPIFALNPVAYLIEEARRVFLWGELPAWKPLALFSAAGYLVAWVGLVWFGRTRKGFSDVL